MSNFTRRHYEAIAAAIYDGTITDARPSKHAQALQAAYVRQARNIAESLAAVFADDNPNFSRARFMHAAGLPVED